MSAKWKLTAEERIALVESYISGRIGCTAACRATGIGEATLKRWVNLYKTEGVAGLVSQKHNRCYPKETKQAAVMDYLNGKGSQQDICNKYGIRRTSILAGWIKVYNSRGEFRILTGGSLMTKGRQTTPEERAEIAKHCISNGNDYGGTAQKYQVSYSQVYGWVRKYRAMGEAGLEDRRGRRAGTLPSRTPEEELRDRIATLEREKLDLEMENALLKKVKELERGRR